MIEKDGSIVRTLDLNTHNIEEVLHDIKTEFNEDSNLGGLILYVKNCDNKWGEIANYLQEQLEATGIEQFMVKVDKSFADEETPEEMAPLFETTFFRSLKVFAVSAPLSENAYDALMQAISENHNLFSSSLDSMALTTDRIHKLNQAISNSGNQFTKLSCTSTRLNCEQADYLITHLPFSVKDLDLTANPLSFHDTKFPAFCNGIANSSLTSLSLSSNATPSKEGLKQLLILVKDSPYLQISVHDPLGFCETSNELAEINKLSEAKNITTLFSLAANAVAKLASDVSLDREFGAEDLPIHCLSQLPPQNLTQFKALQALQQEKLASEDALHERLVEIFRPGIN